MPKKLRPAPKKAKPAPKKAARQSAFEARLDIEAWSRGVVRRRKLTKAERAALAGEMRRKWARELKPLTARQKARERAREKLFQKKIDKTLTKAREREQARLAKELRQVEKRRAELRAALAPPPAPRLSPVAKRARALKVALKGFRPTRREKMSFVFISTQGKRLKRTSTRKGFLVYVTQRGKKVEVRDAPKKGTRRRALPEARKISSFKPAAMGKKRALAKWSGQRYGLREGFTVRPGRKTQRHLTVKEMGGAMAAARRHELLPVAGLGATLDFMKWADQAAAKIRPYARRGVKELQVTLAATVRDLTTGKLHTPVFTVSFMKKDYQTFGAKAFKNFARQTLYAAFANELRGLGGYVSTGSAAFIRRLKANRGRGRLQWQDRKGERWEKNEFKEAKLMQISTEIKAL